MRATFLPLGALLAIGLVTASGIGEGGAATAGKLLSKRNLRPGDAVMLNPQPLPPKEMGGLGLGGEVMLNPQPLPPRWSKLGKGKSF